MRFRLTSLFLVVLLASVSFAWFAEYSSRRQREIVGVWGWPVPDLDQTCATARLLIRADGTFTMTVFGPGGEDRYDGEYRHLSNGQVRFELTDRAAPPPMRFVSTVKIGGEPHTADQEPPPDDNGFYCRCAIDPQGYLLIKCLRKNNWHSGLNLNGVYFAE